MKLGFVGLGKMGSRMVVKLLSEGHEVVVWNRSKERISNFQLLLKNNFSSKKQISNFKYKNNLKAAKNLQDLTGNLDSPRVVWLMVPARSTGSTSSLQASSVSVTGDATQEILDQVEKFIGKDDIVIDGGNAHFGDTQRRYEYFKKKGIHFLGIGVSGGIIAAEEGYPMMAGGAKKGYQYIRPILDSLAKSNGSHQYFGEGGAGHFVKMVHNGIEYGIMQSIGEGFGVLEKSPYNLDLVKVAKLYQKGTLVSGFMMERTIEALAKDPKLSKLTGFIEDSGEGRWTIDQAKKEKVPVEIIEESLDFRVKSRKDPKIAASFVARMVAALRNVFGGHEVKSKTKD
ncbi:hypothetical protein A3J89_01635 [Candidatus Curtissbacteria bacterium RIFOXYB12_FULL_40_6]|nr:MAG: hypothetical protein A3J89_01635 [Candidatus Curtissbacteria bacterium RIFOXYB12_FULL_40_6]